MKKMIFYSLAIAALSFTACKKDKDAFGVHTMNSTTIVKQSGATTIREYNGDEATATSSMQAGGILRLLIEGKKGGFEKLELNFVPKQEYKGTYTLRSKDNANADVIVSYWRTKLPV